MAIYYCLLGDTVRTSYFKFEMQSMNWNECVVVSQEETITKHKKAFWGDMGPGAE